MSTVVDLIEATVRLEQPLRDGEATVGAGFVVTSSAPDGTPRSILVTAQHVFAGMPGDKATVGFRDRGRDGSWLYAPVSVRIRDPQGDPLWTRHPSQDVAAIELPLRVARGGVPATELPGPRALEALGVQPGDEMMTLGFPHGLAANTAGFPILRSGRVASYPLSPADRYPTYMVDLNVYAGNSGGPVYLVRGRQVVITGVLTQQIKLRGDRLAIGNVTQADFISETISLMDGSEPAEVLATSGDLPKSDALQATDAGQPSATDRLRESWDAVLDDLRVLVRRTWMLLRDWVVGLITPDPRRT